jgi:2-polyprenyl-3-methyl-5-hydroxy-6-metoxy-1,4-benzoquinol methylase
LFQHAISLQVLRQGLLQHLQSKKAVKLLDFGCGYGYSTLSFALLADNLIKREGIRGAKLTVVGVDLYSDFIEKGIMNYQNYRKALQN